MSGAAGVILLVEDDPDDVFFMTEAFKRNELPDVLRVARDGEEAVAYLLGEGPFADRGRFPLPLLILLDLKLPRRSGLEVLAWCRRQPGLKRIPIVMLTSSHTRQDLSQAYDLGASSYLVKPVDAEKQLEMVRTLCRYWLGLNAFPGLEVDAAPPDPA